jgi:hypothetical protein
LIKIHSETFNPNKTVAGNDESYENLSHFDANYDRRLLSGCATGKNGLVLNTVGPPLSQPTAAS